MHLIARARRQYHSLEFFEKLRVVLGSNVSVVDLCYQYQPAPKNRHIMLNMNALKHGGYPLPPGKLVHACLHTLGTLLPPPCRVLIKISKLQVLVILLSPHPSLPLCITWRSEKKIGFHIRQNSR